MSAVKIAVLNNEIVYAVISAGIRTPPGRNLSARIVISGTDGDRVVVDETETSVENHVLRSDRGGETVAAGAGNLSQRDVCNVNVFAGTHVDMVIVSSAQSNIADFHVFAVPETYRNNMDSTRAAAPNRNAAQGIEVISSGIHAAKSSLARDFHVLHRIALNERQVVAGTSRGPVYAGNIHVMPYRYVVIIILHTGRLPDHRALFDVEFHVVFHFDVRGDISSAVI